MEELTRGDGSPIEKKDSNPKAAFGCKKPYSFTVSMFFLAAVARVLGAWPHLLAHAVGAAMLEGGFKYRLHNYRIVGVRVSTYANAFGRHMGFRAAGEAIDPDSGIDHWAKAGACLAIIYDGHVMGNVTDDRPPRALPGEWANALFGVDGDTDLAVAHVARYWEGGAVDELAEAGAHLQRTMERQNIGFKDVQAWTISLLDRYPEDNRKEPCTELNRGDGL